MATLIREIRDGLQPELYASPRWLIAAFVVSGFLLVLVYDARLGASGRAMLLLLAAASWLSAVLIWVLDSWNTWVGRTITVLFIVCGVHFLPSWLFASEPLMFDGIPVIAGMALMGPLGATLVGVMESVAILLAAREAVLSTLILRLVAVWLTAVGVWTVYRPLRQVIAWSWEHYDQAQRLLSEERNRNAELEQAMEGLMHANRQLDLLNERLAGMRLLAEEAQRAKAAFVAKVSHELRTPLNMILGLTDLLLETPQVYGEALPPALLEDLRIVQRNSEYLSKLINDVLDLSQAESGRLVLHKEWVDLREEINVVVGAVQPLLEKKRLVWRVEAPSDLPLVYCDRTRVRQVLLNLLSNAARYTDQGGVTIRVCKQGDCVVTEVEDTGCGIPAEDLDKIFEPFYQVSTGVGVAREGSGLGLSISKQIVELHQGRLWVVSTPGVGSTFSFEIPIAPPDQRGAEARRWIREEWTWLDHREPFRLPKPPHRQRVVVYDETGGFHDLADHWPEELDVTMYDDWGQMVSQLQRHPAHVIIVNVASPEDLLPITETLKAQVADTPIVGCYLLPHFDRALEQHILDYLIKPVTRADLREALEAVPGPVRRVQIVDDDPDFCQLGARMLWSFDRSLDIAIASSADEALRQMRQHPPDLMLLDLMLPDLSGWQLLSEKMGDPALTSVPAIVVSAQDPSSQPPVSDVLVSTISRGLSPQKILHCSLALSEILLSTG